MSVLVNAMLTLASARTGEVWVDCTLGYAGHARRLLEHGVHLYGIDRDAAALAHATRVLADFRDRVVLLRGDFRDVARLLDEAGVEQADGFLADIGVSSPQLDQADRGFSFSHAGPVDMRMDRDHGETALDLIRRLDGGALTRILREYGEEPFARSIARKVHAWAAGDGPHDTVTLAAAVATGVPAKARHKRQHHPATRTFQALRIAVNDELGALQALLDSIPDRVAPGGRVLLISFHSLEDRIIKQTFARWTGRTRPQAPRRGLPPPPAPPVWFEDLSRKPLTADADELAANPRARSAKLRGVRRLAEAA